MDPAAAKGDIRIGVSSCLLGAPVRWNGGHKLAPAVARLARVATLVPVCPEVEAGMGTPRPPIRLVRAGRGVRLVEPAGGADHTAAMRAWAGRRLDELERLGLHGFVLKRDSPSCGLEGVPVWAPRPGGAPAADGTGLFAAALRARFPLLPLIDEEALRDAALRAEFLRRARAYGRLDAGAPGGRARGHLGVAARPVRR